MGATKIAITLDEILLRDVDELVARRAYPSRSRAIQEAVREKLDRARRGRLAREAAKLDPAEERGLADEGLAGEAEGWPEY